MRSKVSAWGRWVLVFGSVLATAGAQAAAARTVNGRVLDESGKPIAGAAIRWFGGREMIDSAKTLAEPQLVTNAAGEFSIEWGDAKGYGEIAVVAAGRQSCSVRPSPWSYSAHTASSSGDLGDIVLPPGGKLVGRVRDETGAPLAGVRVRVEASVADRFSYQGRLSAGARSDAKGIFAVPGVPRTGLRVTATCDGYLTESRIAAQESPLDLTLAKVGMVRGKVVDAAGQPIANASIHAVTVESREGAEGTVSAADGSFAITVPTRGRFLLRASEPVAPHRQFASGLLRGAKDEVVLTEMAADADNAVEVVVTVVDAATKQPIPRFTVAPVYAAADNLQIAMFHAAGARRAYDGKAVLPLRLDQQKSFVVEAAGHAFEVVATPAAGGPIEVALGPECVLVGKVLDEQGKPVAGVPVEALPEGRSSGSGGVLDGLPRSDDQGNYRIAGLRPGTYGVQVHSPMSGSSKVFSAKVELGNEAQLDLTVPKERWVDVTLKGNVPPSGSMQLSLSQAVTRMGGGQGFERHLPAPRPVRLVKAGSFRFGPLSRGTRGLEVFVPSRTRVASGTTLRIADLDADAGQTTIDLPDLSLAMVRGRIDLPAGLACERIGVLAHPATRREARRRFDARPTVAGVNGAGAFELDVPAGAYCLQLVDLTTGIVFHTEEQDIVLADGASLVLKPEIRWLTVECVPEHAGDEVVLQSFGITLPPPRNGERGAFLEPGGGSNRAQSGSTPFRAGATTQRWLVPAGEIEVKARQCFEMLRPWVSSYRSIEVGATKLAIDKPEQSIQIVVPAPPSDEELTKRE